MSEPAVPPRLQAEQFVARSAIYPKFMIDGVFHHTSLFRFDKMKSGEPGAPQYIISVSDRAKLTTDELVHLYGCDIESHSNARLAEKLGRAVTADDDRSYYLGFYDLSVQDCHSSAAPGYEVFVEPFVEDGEHEAHCHIVMSETPDMPKKGIDKGALRLATIDRIWRSCVGPKRHVCACNTDLAGTLEQIELKVMPVPNPAGDVAVSQPS